MHMIPKTERVEKILQAADGMTTEEAVKYITHGREMVAYIKGECDDCKSSSEPLPHQCEMCETGKTLKKLEG